MATSNPMKGTYPIKPPAVSKVTFPIAGILTVVYGLKEIPEDVTNIVCLWLLHPRLQTQDCMQPVAASAIDEWNKKLEAFRLPRQRMGLIAASFDQRNHGSREVDKLANESWRLGNARHAQDMFAIYNGTAMDASQLMTYISSYVFPPSDRTIIDNMVLGVSLGGHAAWQCVIHDNRVSTAIIVVGCPDYFSLMSDRARLSKLPSWTGSNPPGSQFYGSKDFPQSLVEAVEDYDPAGFFLGPLCSRTSETYATRPAEEEMSPMKKALERKRILSMSGGADRLVPYRCSEQFCHWLREATASHGWLGEGFMEFEDIVFGSVQHEMNPHMAKEANRFILERLINADGNPRASNL